MGKRSKRNGRYAGGTPQLATIEDTALATADAAVTNTLYTSSTSNSSLTKPVRFTLGPVRVAMKYGSTETTVFAVVRKLPQGYSNPSIAIVDGNTSFVDVPNILAYGVIRVGSTDTMNRLDLRRLRNTVTLNRGDAIILQVVSNVSSTGQAYSALIEFSTI